MTEQEILAIVTDYFTSHWTDIAGAILTGVVILVATTWVVSKTWYKREISYLKNLITSLNQLHNERTQVLKDKADERTNYAEGIVKIAEQRVLAIEHERGNLLERITLIESDLSNTEKILEKSQLEITDSSDNAALAKSRSEAVKELELILSSRAFSEEGSKELSPNISRLVKQIVSEAVSIQTISLFIPIIGSVVGLALKWKLEKEKSTEVLSRFHESYYRSLETIMKPISDESSNINSIDSEKIIDKEIGFLDEERKNDD